MSDQTYKPVLKVAATRQVREMRRLAENKDWRGLEQLAGQLQDAGVLKVSGPGTNLRRLGAGAESINDLVVGAGGDRLADKHPLTVRKVFDKLGPMYSKEQLSEKINLLRRIRNTPNAPLFTELYGGLRKAPGGARYTLNEFVPESQHGNPSNSLRDYITNVGRNTDAVLADAKRRRKVPLGTSVAGFTRPRSSRNTEIVDALYDRNPRAGVRAAINEAEHMLPVRGNPLLFDLHGENVVRLPNGEPKVLDFSVIPAHRINEAKDAGTAYQDATRYRRVADKPPVPEGRGEQLLARIWQAQTGSPLPASAIGKRGGLDAGPKTGKSLGSILSELGPKRAVPQRAMPLTTPTEVPHVTMPVEAPILSEALQTAQDPMRVRVMNFLRRNFDRFRG